MVMAMMPTTIFEWLYLLYVLVFIGMVVTAFRRIPPSPFRTKMATVGGLTTIAMCLTGIVERHFT